MSQGNKKALFRKRDGTDTEVAHDARSDRSLQ